MEKQRVRSYGGADVAISGDSFWKKALVFLVQLFFGGR
jgi:hypothetical protein